MEDKIALYPISIKGNTKSENITEHNQDLKDKKELEKRPAEPLKDLD